MGIKVYNIDALWKIDWFIGILTHDQNENQFSSIVEDRNQKRNPVMIGNHNSYIDTNRKIKLEICLPFIVNQGGGGMILNWNHRIYIHT
jgi:hypothetical protein